MARHFAGHLALATGRESLKGHIERGSRSLLVQSGWNNNADDMISVVITDNIDFLCSIAKVLAADKVLSDVEEAIGPSLEERREHRERTGQPYFDTTMSRKFRELPNLLPLLQLHTPGLLPTQLVVYEEFARDIPPYGSFLFLNVKNLQ